MFNTETLQGARKSGFTDDELTAALVDDQKIKSALDSGFTLDEIASAYDPEPQNPQTAANLGKITMADMGSSALKAITAATRVNPMVKVADFVQSLHGKGMTSQEFITEMEGAADIARDEFGVDPKATKGLLPSVASGFGTMVPTVLSGVAAPLTAGLMSGEAGFREAEQAGATKERQIMAGLGNAATAIVTERLLGVIPMLKSIKGQKVTKEGLKGTIESGLLQGGKGFIRESAQEVSEQMMSDLIALGLYDENRKVLDWEKLAMVGVAGGLVGTGVSGGLQILHDTAPKKIAPKQVMQDAAQAVDESLAQTLEAEPPPITEVPPAVSQTPQGTPVLSPEEIQAVPKAQPGEVPVEEVNPSTMTPEEFDQWSEQQQKSAGSGEAVNIPGLHGTGGRFVATRGARGFIKDALEAGQPVNAALYDRANSQRSIPLPDGYTKQGDQYVKTGVGLSEFVGTAINTPEGLVTKEVGTAHPEMLMEALEKGLPETEMESNLGFAFKKPDGTTEWVDRVEAGRRLTESGQLVGLPEGTPLTSEHIRGEVEGVTFREQTLPTADQVANELQQYRNQAIAAAKASGATDPELAASIAQTELSKQVASGQTRLSDPKSLFISAAENQASKQVRGEQAQKRGGGKVVSGDVGEAGKTAIEEAKTDVGPRAEMVAKETAQSIQDVVNSMPENDQKVMRAFMEDASLTIDEISEQTGLTVDQVKKAKSRATKALAQFVKSQGMGERMAPGASNIRELRNARYTLASDIYEGLRQSGKLTRETFEKNVESQYPELFTKEDFDDLWTVSQMASEQSQESRGRKPMGAIIDELTGAVTGEGQTSLRNKQTDIERRKRGLPAAMEVARRSFGAVWDEAMRRMDENKQLQDETLTKFRDNPGMVPEDWENAILLHAQIEAENNFDRAVDEINTAYDKGDEQGKLEAISRAREAETKLIDTYEIERAAGTAAGRALSARRLTSGRDYTLGRMLAETRASKGGEPLTETEQKQVADEYEGIKRTNAELEERVAQLEEEKARKAYEDTIEEMGTPEDPVTKSLVQRIVERLNSAADAARKRILGRLQRTSANLDPTLLYDLAVIGASKLANGLTRKSKWRSSMESEFGEDIPEIKDSMDEIWDESNRMMDQAIEKVAPKNEKVKERIKNPTNQQIVDSTVEKMGARIKAGDPVEKLRAYVQKIALALVRSGVTKPDPLLDTVHSLVEPMKKGITKREVMDLISGYGDEKALDPEKAKVELRDIKGQLQQRAKLEDIISKQPIKKTGVERRKPSDEERRLIREVNEAKKKYGVVVTDPARQLKSTLDSIKTRVTNEIKDLTHQIETGETPVPGTPAPTSEEIEKLKAIRENLRKFLKDTDVKEEVLPADAHVSEFNKLTRATERALESSIKTYEEQIAGTDTKKQKKTISTPRIEALKAKRDVLKAELEALRAADQNLQDTKTFDRLMKSADELQGKLDRGEVRPQTKATKIEDELVVQARERLQNLRDQMQQARNATPEAQQAKLDAAIKAVEASIKAYDQKLTSGAISPTPSTPKVTSPILERLRAERDAMRKLVETLRKGPPMDPEMAQLKALKARLAKANADIQERLARGDFSKKARKEIDLSKDAEAVRLKAENDKWKREFENRKMENERATEGKLRKALRIGKEGLNIPRAVKSSFDLSAVLRQGGFITFGNPARSLGALRDMFRSFTQKGFEKVDAELRLRKNYSEYKNAKLYLADLDGALDRREEAFRSELADKIPGVKLSNRTYIAFLNRLRADSYDAMIGSFPTTPTQEQKKAIAHFINVATGRGDLGVHGSAAETLSTVFWSPRLLISRIQLLAGEPLMRGDAKGVRKIIAKEYAKTLVGATVVLALGALAGADIEEDPRSSDFGKLKFGETRIDPWFGLQQITTPGARTGMTGLESMGFDTPGMKTQGGKIYSLRVKEGEKRGPYEQTFTDVAKRFAETKFTPLLGGFLHHMSGEDVVGKKGSPLAFKDTFPFVPEIIAPLSFDELVPVMEEQGIPRGTAMQILNLFGMSVQHQEQKGR